MRWGRLVIGMGARSKEAGMHGCWREARVLLVVVR
jgi:hypothetical protein